MSKNLQDLVSRMSGGTATPTSQPPVGSLLSRMQATKDDDEEEYLKELKSTAVGRNIWRERSRAQQIAVVDEELKKKDLKPEVKKSLGALRTYLESPDYGKPVVDHSEKVQYVNEDGMIVSGGSDRARSFMTGMVDALPQLVDLAPAVLEKLGMRGGAITKTRDAIAEMRARNKEVFDARTPGAEGALLEFLGALSNPISLKGYGKIVDKSAKIETGIAKMVGAKKVAEAITKGSTHADPLVRAGTNILTGLPLNLAQQAQESSTASLEDRMKQFAFGVAADAASGAAFGPGKPGPQTPGAPGSLEPGAPPSPILGPDGKIATQVEALTPDRQKIIDEMTEKGKVAQREMADANAKANVEKEQKAYEQAARLQAVAEWQLGNMGKKWNDLSKEARVGIVDEFKAKNDIEWYRSRKAAQDAGTTGAATPPVPAVAPLAATVAVPPAPVEAPPVAAKPLIPEAIPGVAATDNVTHEAIQNRIPGEPAIAPAGGIPDHGYAVGDILSQPGVSRPVEVTAVHPDGGITLRLNSGSSFDIPAHEVGSYTFEKVSSVAPRTPEAKTTAEQLTEFQQAKADAKARMGAGTGALDASLTPDQVVMEVNAGHIEHAPTSEAVNKAAGVLHTVRSGMHPVRTSADRTQVQEALDVLEREFAIRRQIPEQSLVSPEVWNEVNKRLLYEDLAKIRKRFLGEATAPHVPPVAAAATPPMEMPPVEEMSELEKLLAASLQQKGVRPNAAAGAPPPPEIIRPAGVSAVVPEPAVPVAPVEAPLPARPATPTATRAAEEAKVVADLAREMQAQVPGAASGTLPDIPPVTKYDKAGNKWDVTLPGIDKVVSITRDPKKRLWFFTGGEGEPRLAGSGKQEALDNAARMLRGEELVLPQAGAKVQVEEALPFIHQAQKELEDLEDRLLKEMDKHLKRWKKANPNKPESAIKEWDDAAYRETKKQLTEVSNQLMPEASATGPNAVEQGTRPRDPTPEALAATGLPVRPQFDPSAPTAKQNVARRAGVKEDIPPVQIDMKKAQSPRKLTDEEIPLYIDAAHQRIGLGDAEQDAAYMKLIEKLVTEQAERAAQRAMAGAARMPGGVLGAGIGMTYGMISVNQDDPHKAAKVMMWTLAGLAAGHGLQKFAQRLEIGSTVDKRLQNMFPGQEVMKPQQAKIVSMEDRVQPKNSFMTMMSNWYNNAFRKISKFENMEKQLPVQANLPLANRPTQLAEFWNLSIQHMENWMHSVVGVVGPDGELIQMSTILGQEVKPFQQIMAGVNFDKQGLGETATALSVLELHAKGYDNLPMTPEYARMFIANVPAEYIQAARELKMFNTAMLKMMQLSGRVSQAKFEHLSKEDWFTPLYQLVEGGKAVDLRNTRGKKVNEKSALGEKRGTKPLEIVNPVEQTITLLPYILRDKEYSHFVQSTLDLIKLQPLEVQKEVMQRVRVSGTEKAKLMEEEAKALKEAYLLGDEETDRLLAFRETGSPAKGGGGFIRHFENGTATTYKVNEAIFGTAKALLPFERDVVQNILFRNAREITQFTTGNIVHQPGFVKTQFFMDMIDGWFTSHYGFKPGRDSIKGYLAILTRDPRYQRILDVGGLGSLQSIPYQNAKSALGMMHAEGKSAAHVAWNHMKEYNFIQAYKTMALPFAEAARMGEALLALKNGASSIEAMYAARRLGYNASMEGSAQSIRALHQMTLFTRPAIQGVDALARAAHRDPWGFLAKGLTLMTATAGLWWANHNSKNKDEIRKWRKTSTGKGYIYATNPIDGEVMRMRKPHIIGQLFMTSIEEALDEVAMRQETGGKEGDAQIMELMAQMGRDVSANMIPLLGVVPLSLMTDKNMSDLMDIKDITPQMDDGIERKYRGRDRATIPARVVSDATFNVLTPVQVDFIAKTVGGSLGRDFVDGTTQAYEFVAYDYVPARYEIPVIRDLYQNKHAQGEQVYKFYNHLNRIEEVANTMATMSTPAKLATNPFAYQEYYNKNIKEIVLIGSFNAARDAINKYRKALEDMKQMKGLVSQEAFKSMEDQYIQLIDDRARTANTIAESILKAK